MREIGRNLSGSHWGLSESEGKGDGDALKVRTAVMPLLHGNAFMPEQISLGKQVNLFKRCFCDHTFSLFLK